MESDIKSIKESNDVIRQRLDELFSNRDQASSSECQAAANQAEIKSLTGRILELEEKDRTRSEEISAMKREIQAFEMKLKTFINIEKSSQSQADEKNIETQTTTEADPGATGGEDEIDRTAINTNSDAPDKIYSNEIIVKQNEHENFINTKTDKEKPETETVDGTEDVKDSTEQGTASVGKSNIGKETTDETIKIQTGDSDQTGDKLKDTIVAGSQQTENAGVQQGGGYRRQIVDDTETVEDSTKQESGAGGTSKTEKVTTPEAVEMQTGDSDQTDDKLKDTTAATSEQTENTSVQQDQGYRSKVSKPNFLKKVKKAREYKKPPVKHTESTKKWPVEAWWAIIKQEEKAASKTEVKYLDGIQTVLCVDISESMVDSWPEVQNFVYDYLDGLDKLITEENFNEENVALTTFGHETKVKVRLTKEIERVRAAFDDITLGGPSPMFGGILMAVAAAQSSSNDITLGGPSPMFGGILMAVAAAQSSSNDIILGGPSPMFGGILMAVAAAESISSECHVKGAEIHKRIVLITDGHFTEAEVFQGPDKPDLSKQDETFAHIAGILERFPQSGKELVCVPVGKANTDILDQFQNIACGKRFSYKDGGKFSRRFYLTKKAPIGLGLTGGLGLDFGRLLGLGGLGGLSDLPHISIGGLTDESQTEDLSHLSMEDQEHIKEIADDHKALTLESISRKGADRNEKKYEECDNDQFPKIGSRVRRGPDWSWREQDSNGPGTVIGHDESGRQVWVEWDADGHQNIYHYGGSGRYDVLLVDEPRLIKKTDNLKVGCLVQPGDGWQYNFQRVKQYEKGAVIRNVGSNKFQVKWSGGYRGDYYFNRDGPSELRIVSEAQGSSASKEQPPPQKPKKNKNKNMAP